MARLHKGLVALVGFLVLNLNAFATESHAVGGVVFLNNVPVLELKSQHTGPLAAGIAKVLRTVDEDAEVKSFRSGLDYKIKIGSSVMLTISPDEAVEHKVSLQNLAQRWESQIRDALSLPPLKFSADYLRVPLGTTKEVGLVGSLAFAAVVSSTNEAVVRVERTSSGFDARFVGVGDAQIKAVSGNGTRSLNVAVRPYAGNFPQELSADVTGDPANGSTVTGALSGCIRTRLVSLPTAVSTFDPVQADALGSGRSRTYTVRVRLRAPEAFDGVGDVTVTVRNRIVPTRPDTALWYSNAPESVYQPGPLFSSMLKRDAPIRLLYHHADASSQPIILRVEAINDSDQTAAVVITPGDSKPDRNPVRAGMTAANQFLHSLMTGSGEVVTLPPHTTFPISIRRLSPKETASGLCDLRLIDGPSEVQVRTDALPAFDLHGSWYDASLSSTPWRETGTHPINDYDRALSEPSQHVYPNPYKDERIEYTVGGRYGFLLIGQKPISGEDHTNNLDGNFGVIYKIKASLQNPTDTATDVDLVFEASAGYMGGLFVIGDKLIQTQLLGPKEQTRITRVHLAPGAKQSFDILTLPVSGGSYPATLFLKPVSRGT